MSSRFLRFWSGTACCRIEHRDIGVTVTRVIICDGMDFRDSPLHLNDEEFEAFTRDYAKLVRKYERIGARPDRRLRKFSALICPILPEGGDSDFL